MPDVEIYCTSCGKTYPCGCSESRWLRARVPTEEFTLVGNMDARVWAEAFVEEHGGDEDLMVTWFSNAIMTGFDNGRLGTADRINKLEKLLGRCSDTCLDLSSDIEDLLGREEVPDAANSEPTS